MDENIKMIVSNIPVAAAAVNDSLNLLVFNETMKNMLSQAGFDHERIVLSDILDIRAMKTLRWKLCQEFETSPSEPLRGTLFSGEQIRMKVEIAWKRYESDRFKGWLLIFYRVDKYVDEIESLKIRATKDQLTGIYNRWEFHNQFDDEIRKTKRYQDSLALALIDVDDFKSVNDTYGHPAGDSLLVNLAREIQPVLRESDIFARIGGDEFAILMPHTNEQQANEVAKRIVDRVSNKQFMYDGSILDVGVSIGIAASNGTAANKAKMIQICDDQLYRDKSRKRESNLDRRAQVA